MKTVFAITDESIRYKLEDTVTDCEENEWIKFPDNETRSEFIEECCSEIIEYYENKEFYDYPHGNYEPNYYDTVLDNAKLYGYCVDDWLKGENKNEKPFPKLHYSLYGIIKTAYHIH